MTEFDERMIKELLQNEEIPYVGEPFMAIIAEKDGLKNKTPTRCWPIVYDSLTCCGVGLICQSGKSRAYGLMVPRNLIASWRAVKIMERMTRIKNHTLCSAYHAALRNPIHVKDRETIVEGIGKTPYEQIMEMPVPKEIIQAILDCQGEPIRAASLKPLAEEVRLGKIAWQPEFKKFGIETIAQSEIRENMIEQVKKDYRDLFESFTFFSGAHPKSPWMEKTEQVLASLEVFGVTGQHSKDINLAFAAAVGGAIYYPDYKLIQLYEPLPLKDFPNWKVIEWLANNRKRSIFRIWEKRDPLENDEIVRGIIEKMREEYFPKQKEATR